MDSLRKFSGKAWSSFAAISTFLLVGCVGILVTANYISQIEIQKARLERFQKAAEQRAGALSNFFEACRSDFTDLSSNRVLSDFFENKALGMSMKYGLQANLDQIGTLFRKVIAEKRLHGDRIYSRIVFIDSEGYVLHSTDVWLSNMVARDDWKTYLTRDASEPAIIISSDGGHASAAVSMPFFFKERYSGQLIGWILSETIFENFIGPRDHLSRGFFYLLSSDQSFHLTEDLNAEKLPERLPTLDDLSTEGIGHFEMSSEGGEHEKVFTSCIRVSATPFYLVSIAPALDVLGSVAPWQLPLAAGAFSLLVLGGAVFFWKTRAQNLVLSVRIEESARSGREIALKNQELVQEIAERKRAEEALQESEKRYRMLVDTMNEGLGVQDENGRITYCNDKLCELLGYSREELIGRLVTSCISEGDRSVYMESMARRKGGDHASLSHEVELLRKDGTTLSALVSISNIFSEKGEFMGSVAAITDISRLKQTEERLRHLSSRLLCAQEEERKRIARDLHDSIGQTLAALKFNVENAMQSVNRENPEELFRLLELIIPIIRSAIEETRAIYMGLRPSILDDFGVLATIKWFGREFQKTYPNHYVEVETAVDEPDIPGHLKVTIFRIVQEGLNNVAKHSRAELVNVCLAKTEDQIALTIEDNGEGFDVQAVLSRTNPGRGMGLSSMRERAELSGGTFSVASIEGEGTVIQTTWPLPVQESAAANSPPQAYAASEKQ